MTYLSTISTYLPPWEKAGRRLPGGDEDTVTMAVEVGRAALESASAARSALDSPTYVERVVLVTRDLPLLEGGNAAALLAGLGLPRDIEVEERIGGAPTALDAVLSARPRTLVIAADLDPAGAGAALVAAEGLHLRPVSRVNRSLPVMTRSGGGAAHSYDDPRLLRERGLKESLRQAGPQDKATVVAGVPHGQAKALCAGEPPRLPTLGASATMFALAALAERGASAPALLVASEQAMLTAAAADATPTAGTAPVTVLRLEPEARPVPVARHTPGPEIPLSLAAYERAFDPKVRWEAARCDGCGTLAYPPRHRCRECGAESRWSSVPLPRRAEVYTAVTVHVPVPGLSTPFSLAMVQLEGLDVRVLVKTTASEAGSVAIGDTGRMTLRRVAVRSGVPDYGYAFWPDGPDGPDGAVGDEEVTA